MILKPVPKHNGQSLYLSIMIVKYPIIPSLLVNNNIVSDFTEKANLFNDFFATQCIPLSKHSVVPSALSQDYLLLILKKYSKILIF